MPRVQLILDEPSEELLREGFGLTVPAGALRGSRWVPDYDEHGGRYVPGDLAYKDGDGGAMLESEDIWRIPEEGIVFPRPNALRSDLLTDSSYAGDWMALSAFDVNPNDFLEVVREDMEGKPRVLLTKRGTGGADLTGIATPPRADGLNVAARGMVWAANSTAILKANEGLSIFATPFGAGADKAQALFGLMFGARFYLEAGSDGWGDLWQDVSKAGSSANWLRRRRFETGLGGFSDGASLQIAIVPWGIDAITVVFSTAPGAGQESSSAGSDGALTFHGRRYDWDFPWDAALNHNRKTEAAPIRLALPKNRQSQIGLLRLRYKSVKWCANEIALGGPKPDQNVRIATIGFAPSGATAVRDFTGVRGTFDAATDDRIVPFGTLIPGDPAHPPELWAIEVRADAKRYTANTTPLDFSHLWRRLEGRSTLLCEPTSLDALLDRSGDVDRLLRLYGTARAIVEGETVFRGKVEANRPVLEGGLDEIQEEDPTRRVYGMVTDDLQAVDEWADLESTPASHSTSFAKRTVGIIIQDAMERAGKPPASYSIHADLYDWEVDGWDRADDFKSPHEDSSFADVIGVLSRRYGVQGHAGVVRVRALRDNGVLVFRPSKDWQPGDVPDGYIWLHPECLPEDLDGATEDERWDASPWWCKGLDNLEWLITPPEMDAMRAWAVSGAGDGADTIDAYISFDPARSGPEADPDSLDFVRRPRTVSYGPPQTAMATTPNELERLARREYDERSRIGRLASLSTEWRPKGKADRIVVVLGMRPDTGTVCTFGAFRLLDVSWCLLGDEPVTEEIPETGEGEPPMPLSEHGRALQWTSRVTLDFLGDPQMDGFPLVTENPL